MVSEQIYWSASSWHSRQASHMGKLRTRVQSAGLLLGALLSLVVPAQASVVCGRVPDILHLPSCVFPSPSRGEKVIMVEVEKGNGYSNQDFFENDWSATQLQDIAVQPGIEPLYVVLKSSSPMIWRFSGSTERIANVVSMGSSMKGIDFSGVIGLSKA
jgi:hypothetical protein